MPESVDSPAPERTTTSPSATRSVSSSSGVAASCSMGAAVTRTSSPRTGDRAASSGEFALEPLQQLVVDPAQPLGREGAFEESADAAGPVPGGAYADRRGPGVGGVHGPGGDHRGV